MFGILRIEIDLALDLEGPEDYWYLTGGLQAGGQIDPDVLLAALENGVVRNHITLYDIS